MKTLKERLRSNQLTIGSWISLAEPAIAEIMAGAGFQWLTVDMEQSAIDLPAAVDLIRVIDLCGVAPLVRVGENNPNIIKRVMDAGSQGVIVPMVNTKDDAQRAVSSATYPPQGLRGVGLARAQKYGFGFKEYKERISKDGVVVAQIEHIEAINNLEEILGVKGIDATIIGPYDLSGSLGYPGEFNKSQVQEALKKYEVVCDKLNKPKGIHVVNPSADEAAKYIGRGYKFLAFSLDTLFLGTQCREKLAAIKELNSREALNE